jgi:CHAT domain-containing protein
MVMRSRVDLMRWLDARWRRAGCRSTIRSRARLLLWGARSLPMSHWEVASESTIKLITKAIAELKANPKIGRAEELRRSMLPMIDPGKDCQAHPAFLAPFVLVGGGEAAR